MDICFTGLQILDIDLDSSLMINIDLNVKKKEKRFPDKEETLRETTLKRETISYVILDSENINHYTTILYYCTLSSRDKCVGKLLGSIRVVVDMGRNVNFNNPLN